MVTNKSVQSYPKLHLNEIHTPTLSKRFQAYALSFGRLLTGLSSLVLTMVLVRVLDKAGFASYQQFLLIYAFAVPVLIMGLPQALFYFLPTSEQRQKAIVIECVALLALIALFFYGGMSLVGLEFVAAQFNNPGLMAIGEWLILLVVSMLPVALLSSVLVVNQQVLTLTKYNVLSRLSITSVAIFCVLLYETLNSAIISYVLMTLITSVAALVLMFRAVPSMRGAPNLSSLRTTVAYAFPLGIVSLVSLIFLQVDKWIVSSMVSLEEFAIYASGAMQIPFVAIVTGAITSVMLPDLRRKVAENDFKEALRLFSLSSEKSSFMLLPLMVFLLISGDAFIQTLFTSEYAKAVEPFRWYLLLLPIRTVMFGGFLASLNKGRMMVLQTLVGLVLNVVLSIYLVRSFGAVGAAIATVVVVWLWVLPTNVFMIVKSTGQSCLDVFPLKSFLRTLCFLVLPSLAIFAVGELLLGYPAHIILIAQSAVFWPIVFVWMHGKVYDVSELKKVLFGRAKS